MMNYTFETKNGKRYTVSAKDYDRARCAAKKLALADGFDWVRAKVVNVTNALS